VDRKNYVNLINEFKKLKNFDIILFTTFSFDPIFFDYVIFSQLVENNQNATILVLVDSQQYGKCIEEATDITGVEYILIPIYDAIFHPKLFIFHSDKRTIAYIGSHNLTSNGITHNFELSCKITDRRVVYECLEYIKAILTRNLNEDNHLLKDYLLRVMSKVVSTIHTPNTGNNTIHLLHNLDAPILQKALSIIKNKGIQIKRVIVISPFFSDEEALLNTIFSEIKPTQIDICIQRYNHNLDIDQIKDLPFIKIKEITFLERRIHSKVIIFEGESRSFILMGSPNFTGPALLKTVGDGNYELALLVETKDVRDLLSEFHMEDIEIEDIKKTARQITTGVTILPKKEYEITIRMAYIDELGRLKMDIESKHVNERLVLNVQSSDGQISEIPITINNLCEVLDISLQDIQNKNKIVKVWFSVDNNPVSNRVIVYNPHKRRSKFSGIKISNLPSYILDSKGLEEIIISLCMLMHKENPLSKPTFSNPKVGDVRPGKLVRGSTRRDLWKILEDLLRVHRRRVIGGGKGSKGGKRSPLGNKGPVVKVGSFESRIFKLENKLVRAFEYKILPYYIHNSINVYSSFLAINLKLSNYLDEDKQLFFLKRVIENLSKLMSNHGISGDEDDKNLIQFISLLVHILFKIIRISNSMNVIHKIGVDMNMMRKLRSILISISDPLKGYRFFKELPKNLNNLNLPYSENDKDIYQKIITNIASEILAMESQQTKKEYMVKVIHLIFSSKTTDEGRFFLFSTIEPHIAAFKEVVKHSIREVDEMELKGFRKTLYEDIMKLITN